MTVTHSDSHPDAKSLSSPGMVAVMVSQFFSAFGDNALLFATLTLLSRLAWPDWTQPVMQMVFVAAYILLAPFVGRLADGFAKGRVMLSANCLKILGCLIICLQGNPFLGYGLVGAGAALYSPAKYGILGEMVHGSQLVKANGLMEASTIAAILTGSVAGGVLADWNLSWALWLCAAMYAFAVLINTLIPRLPAILPGQSWQLWPMLSGFYHTCRLLWQDSSARLSLVGTSLFWGAGVTLRFLLVLWVPTALGITGTTMPTVLNAIVAVGIVIGAGIAARWIALEQAKRTVPAGAALGLVVIFLSLQTSLYASGLLLILIGILGGLFIVPLNALLQERGKQSVGAGNAVAVQNLGENSSMLLMLGLYALAVHAGFAVVTIGIGFGLCFALLIGGLWFWGRKI
ncbi:MAG: lysophospholipid transporter LplT [Enterobacteriaceae bacterium]